MPSWLRNLQDRHSLIDDELDYEQDYKQAATGNRATVQVGACRLAAFAIALVALAGSPGVWVG